MTGKLCNTSSHTCVACSTDTACKGDTTYGSTTICLAGACTSGDCHDTSSDCTAGQICGVSSPHTCGACASDAQCTSDITRYGAGNICYQGACQLGNCHATSSDCTAANQTRICGASTPNNCGSCGTDGQCKADAFYGSSFICTTAAGPANGTCVSAVCGTNSTTCAANSADFCCGNLCVPGNCCSDTDCANNPSFGVGFACVSNSCTQCAPASGNKYYVDPIGGNDQTASGSGLSGANPTPSCRFKTITRAIQVIGNFAAANTKVIIVGASGQITGLVAGDVLPITLPPNVVISTQGGPITITMPAAANQANPNNNSGFVLSGNGSGISGDPTAPLTLEGGGTSGKAVTVSGAGTIATLSNVTIRNTRDHAIVVTAGTLNIGAGVVEQTAGLVSPAIARDGILVSGGVANINVPAGQAQTTFNSNTSHGIEVSALGSVNVTGVPGAPVPSSNGTVVSNFNATAGLRILQTVGGAGLTSTINGLVTWANNNYGARIFGGAKIKMRNNVFLSNAIDGVLVSPNGSTVAGSNLANIDLGATGDVGHNYFQVPLGALGLNPTAGLCVSMTANLGTTLTLKAVGNFMVSGATQVDCATSTATITRGTCTARNSLGVAASGTTVVAVDVSGCM